MEQPIHLRPIRTDDYIHFLAWSTDETFCLANGWDMNRSEEEIYRWVHHIVHHHPSDFVRLGIEYDGRLIGYGDIACIKDRTAEIGMAIGEKCLWGEKGLEAVR